MAKTASKMIPLGTVAPDFTLPDTLSNKEISLTEIAAEKATVVMFICNHCPFVKHLINEIVDLAKEYNSQGINFVAISSNDAKNYPEDAPDKMKELAISMHFPFPYLYDETQEVAKSYGAECTPDFFVFDKDLGCVYRGRFDESTPENDIPATGNDLRNTLKQILEGKNVDEKQYPSIGCNIKWK